MFKHARRTSRSSARGFTLIECLDVEPAEREAEERQQEH
jgi:hypothetical protein